MCGADDQWVKSAMADDTIVVDLLLRLHGTAAVISPLPLPRSLNPVVLPLEWSVRQRRSVAGHQKKQAQRASPTTPLAFSGATSFSGVSGGSGGGSGSGSAGAGGCEESSSRPPVKKHYAAARSKVNTEGEKSGSKRSRKKTLPEWKDEHRSLLQEKRELNKEIAVLRSDLEKQRLVNENLKRMKIELQPSPDKGTRVARESNPDPSPTTHHSITLPTIPTSVDVSPQPSTSTAHPELFNPVFALPDLNIPFEESPHPEVTCGVS